MPHLQDFEPNSRSIGNDRLAIRICMPDKLLSGMFSEVKHDKIIRAKLIK